MRTGVLVDCRSLSLGVISLLAAGFCWAQEPRADPPSAAATVAGEADADIPERRRVRWNEFEGPFATLRFGGNFMYDFVSFSQDETSKQQIEVTPSSKLRDFRFVMNGRFPGFDRKVTWSAGFMYDAPTESWLVRQTGVMVELHELWGNLFIGRTKEGFSMLKIMSGNHGWGQERPTISDATIPILADGVKWTGHLPERGLTWNVGWFGDWLSSGETFSTYKSQLVTRLVWLPVRADVEQELLHFGVALRYGEPEDGLLQLRSRPEAFPAPYFVDTGRFAANDTLMAGLEAYYRSGPILIGSEYFLQQVNSSQTGNPFFHGGDVVVSWLITGETRPYKNAGGYFLAVSPASSVFQGGPGAWEGTLRLSYIDLDSGTLRGGKFWRVTPGVNWHMNDYVRLELTYGYGALDRFEQTGHTQFFQARIQVSL